ncbi:ribosome small subunit-dependent GTPase A [Gemmatimonas sp.]|uniref:ribosome small subunit-dependent GTPase A n=1 Tax=Gemmatimonas sp. TaxID=1962908 RepID=UPI0037BFE623
MTRDASLFVQQGPAPPPDHAVEGVVVQGTGGVWDVRLASGSVVSASLRGRLKHEAHGALKLAVGDRVRLSWDNGDPGAWFITDIHERSSKLARRAPGGARGERVVVANLDQVLVVFAAARPEPHPRMLDRFLVIAEANGLLARIVVNKCDLVAPEAARALFAEHVAAGYPVHYTSVKTGEGLEALRAELAGRSSALSGPSGVGKSSLMNELFPGLELRTAAISDSVNKGRHTTVGAVLHPLPGGGFLADTPGLREVGLWGIDPAELPHCFPEFVPLLGSCRFADCLHTVEPACAIRDAVERGTIARGRYESYVKLREELAA